MNLNACLGRLPGEELAHAEAGDVHLDRDEGESSPHSRRAMSIRRKAAAPGFSSSAVTG